MTKGGLDWMQRAVASGEVSAELASRMTDLASLFAKYIDDEAIERTKVDLDESATREALLLATIFRELAEDTEFHASELDADGFAMRGDEARQRAGSYRYCYESICEQWPQECEHQWEKKYQGGSPDTAEAREVIEVCKECGAHR